MAAYYHVQELASGLRVQVHLDLDRLQRLLVAVVAAIAVGVFTALLLGGWWWTILSVTAAVVAFVAREDERRQYTRCVCGLFDRCFLLK